MSKRREELLEQYEDALFALLMDDYIEKEGQRLREENERLKNDPAAAVPEDVRQRCIKTIRRECARKDRRAAGRVTLRVLNGIAVAVAICTLLFTTAFAVSPEFRATTLNLLIEISEKYTTLKMSGDRDEQPAADENVPTADGDQLLLGYHLPEVPEGFVFDCANSDRFQSWIQFVDDNGATIRFNVQKTSGGDRIVDTENTQVEDIQIHGYDGMIIAKYYGFENDVTTESVIIAWGDTQQGTFVSVRCLGISREMALELAYGIEFESEIS